MSTKKEIKDPKQLYLIAAAAFLCAGVLFYFSSSTRALSLALPVLGITFLIIGLSGKSKQGS